MGRLDEIISDATNDDVSTSNLLRKVQIVGHYLRADEISAWAKGELNGFEEPARTPAYRRGLRVPVMGTWTGLGGAYAKQQLSLQGIPPDALDPLFTMTLMQPVSELEELALLDEDPGNFWDPSAVALYNQWCEDGMVPHLEMMSLLTARRTISRARIRGVLNTIRNNALELALELETADPQSGSPDGPTTVEPDIREVVYQITNNIYGDGANLAQGSHNEMHSQVIVGDVESLVSAARDVGLGAEALAELRDAATSPEDVRKSRLHAVLDRIRSGGLAVATAVSTDLIAGRLTPLIQQFLG